ncbi:polyhydroxyalkanoic acid system family protein [Sphingosinicella soli]|uniref:Polyhydroxyalkanoic acid system protein n=1 Tax=Sphingosinicella soli TaxID=333708 RepID=A0A7W7AYX4_9SPHN|nr:polyhydroxyalkanoic acid system family protein [Sphingosinicella soli]MBB4630926.1 hypothetical protein [Sphingosinicella soli]
MAQPIRFDIPHRLGRAEARRRMDGGLDDLDRAMPFASRIDKTWQEDRLVVEVTAMGQVTTAHLDVGDDHVHVALALPGLLGMFGEKIAGFFRKRTTELLEDKSKR